MTTEKGRVRIILAVIFFISTTLTMIAAGFTGIDINNHEEWARIGLDYMFGSGALTIMVLSGFVIVFKLNKV